MHFRNLNVLYPDMWLAQIDFQVAGRSTDERGNKEVLIREMRRAL